MIRLSIAALLGAIAAAVVANRLGGTLGNGVWAGFLLGGGITGLGVLYQRHALIYHPERAMTAMLISFLAKLFFLLMGMLTFRYLEAAALRVDYRSFSVAFGASVAILLPLGALDLAGLTKRTRKPVDAKVSI